MEVITWRYLRYGGEKKEQVRIMMMLYVCTNKNKTTPTKTKRHGTWKRDCRSQLALPVIFRAEDSHHTTFRLGRLISGLKM